MNCGIYGSKLSKEDIWTYIDNIFVKSINLTLESVDGKSFSPKVDGVDGMIGIKNTASISYLNSGKFWLVKLCYIPSLANL